MKDKEIINADCSRNWQANILLDNLKRLEQENAELKALISLRDKSVTAQAEIILKLKAENEKLKRENEIITGMHNSSSNRFDKLYKTIQEIKEIAEQSNVDCIYRISVIRKILTKAESEEENER